MMKPISVVIFIIWIISGVIEQVRKASKKDDDALEVDYDEIESLNNQSVFLGKMSSELPLEDMEESDLSPREESSMTEAQPFSQDDMDDDTLNDYYDAQELASIEYYNTLEFNDSDFDNDLEDNLEVQGRESNNLRRSRYSLNAKNIRDAITVNEILSKPKSIGLMKSKRSKQ
ncbi:hypothetical protein KBI51_03575 [Aerococcaceae bacterium zg-ZUI334]|uniref:hypothetical protein n=1 Tax=Aerococcaceae bacterium zg-252 TaxID=2796928 RepID=UPI001B8EE89C|nr:hypothetical protein [Aerococcaceae bacterium zg-ZUI334]